MDFMISLFGSDQNGRAKVRNKRFVQHCKLKHSPTDDDMTSGPTSSRLRAQALPPEDEEGNVEYKLKLVNPSPSRFQHLVTQMKWRLREGQGEAIYEIGVEDDGRCTGLSQQEMDASTSTLKRMAAELDASLTVLRERQVCESVTSCCVAEILVRKIADHQQFIDLRIAVLGAAGAGKSTLLGVLTQGEMDNGRGKSRLNLFRHMHEVQTGRTSSISTDVLGFDAEGKALNQQHLSVEEIFDQSTKLITFIDLAGHQKYMKTTLFGLTGYNPHFVGLVVAANMGIVGTTKDHIAWAVALEVPFFIVVTKIDKISCGLKLEKMLAGLEFFLKQPCYSRICARVRTDDDALTLAPSFSSSKYARRGVVPIFAVSSVSGENLDLVERFLNLLPSYSIRDLDSHLQDEPEFQIDEIFNVSDVGVVAFGLLSKGVLREGDHLIVGPNCDGRFAAVVVDTLQRNRMPCRLIKAGQAAAVSLGDFNEFPLRKGIVLIGPHCQTGLFSVWFVEAEIYVIHHPHRYIAENFHCTVYVGNVCQTAIVTQISNGTRSVSVGQNAHVTFKFLRYPEYVTPGSRLLFREGRTKGIGQILRVGDGQKFSENATEH